MEQDSSERHTAKGEGAVNQNHPDITSKSSLLRARGWTTDLSRSLRTSVFYGSVTTGDSMQPRPLNPCWLATNFCCDA